MEDRKLLELAAKAAGLDADLTGDKILVSSLFRGHLKNWDIWDPLADDGDALRLAVKLNIGHGNPGMRLSIDWQAADDPYAATRRAIVRAAAAMVKA